MEVQSGVLEQVDGSSIWLQNVTKVICSVSGPMEVKPRDEIPDKATLELVVRPIAGLSNTREILIQDRINSVLSSIILRHLHPRSLIQIVVQILESGEPTAYSCRELATGINTAIVALVDAGVPLQGLALATSLAITNDNKYIFDPSAEVLNSGNVSSTHVFAYEIRDGVANRLLLCESAGSFDESQLFESMDKALTHCEELYSTLRNILGQKIEQKFIWKSTD